MTNKDKSQQQIPPGIVAFKNIAGGLMKFDESGVAKYENWVKWRMQEPNTIHTISVDGKEYSVGEHVKSISGEYIIEEFRYLEDNHWHFSGKDVNKPEGLTWSGYAIHLSKLPPPSQPGKEVWEILRDEEPGFWNNPSQPVQGKEELIKFANWIYATDYSDLGLMDGEKLVEVYLKVKDK